MEPTYVALLRGINVGGKNRTLMADLVSCFVSAGYEDVRTFIQTGNVVFRAERGRRTHLTAAIERVLGDAFDGDVTVALRDLDAMRAVVDAEPPGFGAEPHRRRHDVFFLIPPLTSDEVLGALPLADGVDEAWAGPGVVYHSRLIIRSSRCRDDEGSRVGWTGPLSIAAHHREELRRRVPVPDRDAPVRGVRHEP